MESFLRKSVDRLNFVVYFILPMLLVTMCEKTHSKITYGSLAILKISGEPFDIFEWGHQGHLTVTLGHRERKWIYGSFLLRLSVDIIFVVLWLKKSVRASICWSDWLTAWLHDCSRLAACIVFTYSSDFNRLLKRFLQFHSLKRQLCFLKCNIPLIHVPSTTPCKRAPQFFSKNHVNCLSNNFSNVIPCQAHAIICEMDPILSVNRV